MVVLSIIHGILTGTTSSFAHHPWQKQEVFKGVNAAGSLSAGWGFYCWPTNINSETVWMKYSSADANAMVADGSVVTNAVFDRGVSAMFKTAMTDFEIADILAFQIPAVSSPAGKVAALNGEGANFDLNGRENLNGWGRNVDKISNSDDETTNASAVECLWLHSDIKNMAYFYSRQNYASVDYLRKDRYTVSIVS